MITDLRHLGFLFLTTLSISPPARLPWRGCRGMDDDFGREDGREDGGKSSREDGRVCITSSSFSWRP